MRLRLTLSFLLLLLPVFLAAVPPWCRGSQGQPDTMAAASAAEAVLRQRCFACHGQNGVATKNVFVLDRDRLVATRMVVPGDAKSLLLQVVESGSMPLGGPRLAELELQALREWVAKGAPDWKAGTPADARKFLTEAELLEAIRRDLAGAPAQDRRHLRYYSIAHLANAGVPEAELEGYRLGLARLVNSLSWNRVITRPATIDPARVLLRIDLRSFGWTADTWRFVVEAYPYAVRRRGAEAVTSLSGAAVPYVRADWFVARASVPPLYHDLLGLPETVRELEQGLRVDSAANLDERKGVMRGGVRSSGVSRNNRVVERHSTSWGSYWKSHDFSGNQGEQNIFRDPIAFKPDGGEMIFNLPNGLQAYFIADAEGRRLDRAPVEIVADRNYPDEPQVVNGRSCMACHFEGMKGFRDDVRSVVSQQPAAGYDRRWALALYPPQEALEKALQSDRERFRAAVEQTGGRLSADFRTEPISALARKFGADLPAAQAAAEAGMELKPFQEQLRASPRLTSLGFGQLLVAGGGIKRDAWEEQFGDLVSELRLGEYLKRGSSLSVTRHLLVSNHEADSVLRFDAATGAFKDVFIPRRTGGLAGPSDMTVGPDGALYVASFNSHAVLRFDPRTGRFLGPFVPTGSGGLNRPHSLVFGPDGNLYVSSFGTGSILRYQGRNGQLLGPFVEPGGGGLREPNGLAFGPDRHLYVASYGTHQILRYDGRSGRFLGEFTSGRAPTMANVLAFGPDGHLYVCVHGDENGVYSYDGRTGVFRGVLVPRGRGELNMPAGIAFLRDGSLIVVGQHSNNLLRFHARTGAFMGALGAGAGFKMPAQVIAAP